MLTSLLLILGLKTGLIDAMTRRLIENPANREVIPVGAGQYDQTFFDAVRRFEETAFLVPSTRHRGPLHLRAPSGERSDAAGPRLAADRLG